MEQLLRVLWLCSVLFNYIKKLRLSDEREREMGKEGLREIGVFLQESLMSTSLIVLNGSLFLGSCCQHSRTRSWREGRKRNYRNRHIKMSYTQLMYDQIPLHHHGPGLYSEITR